TSKPTSIWVRQARCWNEIIFRHRAPSTPGRSPADLNQACLQKCILLNRAAEPKTRRVDFPKCCSAVSRGRTRKDERWNHGTSKSLFPVIFTSGGHACGRVKIEGRNNARYSSHRLADIGADRRHPALGLQFRLGLRPVGTRRRSADRGDHPGVERTRLTAFQRASGFFTSATSYFNVNGLARNAYCSWLGRLRLKASSA